MMRIQESRNAEVASLGSVLVDCAPSWFAVYTKPRQEQVALANLERQSFECYLPMAGNKTRRESLFPRYLFLSAIPERQSMDSVRSTRGVVGLVRSGLELTKIPASVIAALKNLMHPTTGLIAIDSDEPSVGDKVKVMDGPLAALEGVFKEHRGASRSLLLLDILGRETAVEVDARLLQRIK